MPPEMASAASMAARELLAQASSTFVMGGEGAPPRQLADALLRVTPEGMQANTQYHYSFAHGYASFDRLSPSTSSGCVLRRTELERHDIVTLAVNAGLLDDQIPRHPDAH